MPSHASNSSFYSGGLSAVVPSRFSAVSWVPFLAHEAAKGSEADVVLRMRNAAAGRSVTLERIRAIVGWSSRSLEEERNRDGRARIGQNSRSHRPKTGATFCRDHVLIRSQLPNDDAGFLCSPWCVAVVLISQA